MTNAEMDKRIKELKELEELAAELKKEAEAIRGELKAELDTRKADSVDTGLHRVFYSCYEKKSVDTAKLRDAGLYDKFAKLSTVIQFRITDVKVI